MPLSRYKLITSAEEALTCLISLQHPSLIGLDTETSYEPNLKRMRLSLVQIAHADDPVIIFDALAINLEPLRSLIESPAVQMAAHNARFDEGVLVDAGFAPRGFVDTLQLARRTLRLPSYSLMDVVEELFSERHDKRLQKSNWKKRPLTNEQLLYAAQDAVLTLRVFQELRGRLQAAEKFDEALSAAQLEPRRADERKPRSRRNVRLQLASLSRAEKEIVKKLKQWRLSYARAHHTPAYMICSDKTLEHLAQAKPTMLDELNAIYGLGEAKVARFGTELLQALRTAVGEEENDDSSL